MKVVLVNRRSLAEKAKTRSTSHRPPILTIIAGDMTIASCRQAASWGEMHQCSQGSDKNPNALFWGEQGSDTLRGGPGNDYLDGGGNNDTAKTAVTTSLAAMETTTQWWHRRRLSQRRVRQRHPDWRQINIFRRQRRHQGFQPWPRRHDLHRRREIRFQNICRSRTKVQS